MLESISQNSYSFCANLVPIQKITIAIAVISKLAMQALQTAFKSLSSYASKASPVVAVTLLAAAMIINQLSMWKLDKTPPSVETKTTIHDDVGYSYWS